jgi:hypothetical protein
MTGNYTPPACDFNRVIVNFTVTSAGRQFDRLALMYFGDTEVWRTSTAEPRAAPGIIWTYWKDMTEYLYFWKSPQTLIFDLGNLIDDKYTGPFNTTLTATFFTSDVPTDNASPADLIIPISARKGGIKEISAWNIPDQEATNTISFPQNVRRAVFSVSANGQQAEEFWWGNVLQSDANVFAPTLGGALPGLSPFREVQVLIDGQLAGVQWPFPVLFTGGISPTFHRPIVGLDAFDLREHEIDITAWLPLLCDGKQHTFKIQVGGVDDTGVTPKVTDKVASYWVITGKIFVWLDDAGSVTTGKPPTILTPAPTISLSHVVGENEEGFNQSLAFSVGISRQISISGEVTTSKGTIKPTWKQDLKYSNIADLENFADDSVNTMNITGRDEASGPFEYSTEYSYPFWVKSSYRADSTGAFTLQADLYQGLDLQVQGATVFPTGLEAFAALQRTRRAKFEASKLSTFREGSASFGQSGDGRSGYGFGNTRQELTFGGVSRAGMLGSRPDVPLYYRDVSAINDTVIYDRERLADVGGPGYDAREGGVASVAAAEFAPVPHTGAGIRAFMGREAESQVQELEGRLAIVNGQRLLG